MPPDLARDLIVHSTSPLNAETPADRLRTAYVTPQAEFYIRSHGPIPSLDAEGYRLRVDGRVQTPLDLSLAELSDRFAPHTVSSVMQCAGNRRSELVPVKPVAGDPWGPGAIGNAQWSGVALADVLRAAGVSEDTSSLHVAFTAADEVEIEGETGQYGASIPLAKAMQPEVLLARAMNGEALAPEHGFPLRAVVPGFAGVRSVKWITGIEIRDTPAETTIQRKDYKYFPPDVAKNDAQWEHGVTINEMPLTSAICVPAKNATLPAGRTRIAGYAHATAREIVRVDVSIDGGRHWSQAECEHDPTAPWSWTFWDVVLELPKGEHELAVRAWDSAMQTQPALPDDAWNFAGYLCSAWHRIRVTAE